MITDPPQPPQKQTLPSGTKGTPDRLGQPVADAEAHRDAEEEVYPVRLLAEDVLDRLRRQQPHAANRAAERERRHDARDGARVPVTVGRPDLRQPPRRPVGRGRVGRRAGRDLDQDTVRVEAGQVERERRRRDDLGAPVPVSLPRADLEVRVERAGDLLVDEPGQALAGHPADDLAEEVAEGERVVAGGGPRLPPRRLGGQRGRRALQVVHVVGRRTGCSSRPRRRCGSSGA